MNALKRAAKELKQYPSAIAGFLLIAFLIVLALYTLFTIPYNEAIQLWRGADNIWIHTPRNAPPKWINLFRQNKLPETIVLDTTEDETLKHVEKIDEDFYEASLEFTFDYEYDAFPNELTLFLTAQYEFVEPYVEMSWHTPDGRVIRLGDRSVRRSETYRISQDDTLRSRRLNNLAPEVGLFLDPDSDAASPKPLKGTYKLVVDGLLFEESAELNANLTVYGKVHGLAGTDHRRRDLMVALLWGTPVALAFGLVAAVGTTMTTMALAAMGVWYGGWIDAFIRRITEVNLILPALPILIMVGTFYSRSIWVILGVVILLNIFSGGIMTYRSMFLQVKEAGYIDAARSYGASNGRIIFRYMLPRVIPVLVPQFVVLIPSFVFLEASLAVLGLGDPVLPTWGKLLNDAYTNGALYMGHYYWVLQPAVLLMLAGLGFSMLGFALDRVFNPRLRGL